MSDSNIPATPDSVLVRLKNKLCLELGIDPYKLKTLVDNYVSRTNQQAGTTSKSHFAKVNIYNELCKPRMTIKVLFKFFRILMIPKVNIAITITTSRGREVTVSDTFNLFTDGKEEEGGDDE